MKNILKKTWPHLTAILSFVVISLLYMSPVFEGKILNQPDHVNWVGMSQEIMDHREKFDEDPMWTNSMFGGMPATQISIEYPGRLISDISNVFKLGIPRPAEMIFLYMLGFYILLMCLRVNPWLALGGSMFFALSSYPIIIVLAGHNAKAFAIAYMAPVIGSFLLAYRRKLWLGAALSALFMGLELNSNHPQISYYLLIILVALGIVELFSAIKSKELFPFVKKTGILLIAYSLGFLMTCGNLFSSMDYSEYTIRGKSDLTIGPDSTLVSNNQTSGLDIDYATQWSYGKGESFSFVIPNAKGGETKAIGNGEYTEELADLPRKFQESVAGNNQYWGDQPFVLGPVYLGAIVCLLFLLGMVYVKDRLKWGILAACILALLLSWGNNFLSLTEFFLQNIPFYNKFRAVSMILVILEVCVPLLAVLFLAQLYSKRDEIKNNPKGLLIVSGSVVVIFILFSITPTTFFSFLSENEILSFDSQLEQYANNNNAVNAISSQMDALQQFRIAIFKKDVITGIFLLLFGCLAPLFIFIFIDGLGKRKTAVVFVWICLFATMDLWSVDKRYLHNKHSGSGKGKTYQLWVDKVNKEYPLIANRGDREILKSEISENTDLENQIDKAKSDIEKTFSKKLRLKKSTKQKIIDQAIFGTLNQSTNYRVFDQSGGFNSSRASYFHKSIGGYHGAKLRRYQELIDFHLSRGNINVFNMLNTKYFLSPNEKGQMGVSLNPGALGNAWCVDNVEWVSSPDEEILSLYVIDPSKTVILNEKYREGVKNNNYNAQAGTISMTNYKANEIKYDFNSVSDQLVVFSEIYYKDGWVATIDGSETEILQGNYTLRTIAVPSGNHEIVFSYSDSKVNKYGLIMLISSILVILALALTIILEFRNISEQSILNQDV